MPRHSVLLLATLFAAGCNWSGCTPPSTVPVPPSTNVNPQPINGLTGADATRFHHLSEGSEVYPVAWMLALTTDGKPFLDNPERFGLLPDSDRGDDNPYGLPIGVTADFTRDLRFAGVKMTGVNCAACHVNELQQGRKVVMRIDGSPNLFDLELFYSGLISASLATIEDPAKAYAFLRRLSEVPQPANAPLTLVDSIPTHTKSALKAYPTLDSLKKGGALEKDLAARIESLHKEEKAKPARNLRKGLTTTADSGILADHAKVLRTPGEAHKAKITPELRAAAHKLRLDTIPQPDLGSVADIAGKDPGATSPWANLDVGTRTTATTDLLTQFADTIGLMKARIEYLTSIGGLPEGTAPGYGRVDAFGGARNLIFGTKLPLNAPISYPHLWNLNEKNWLHWDENTTSLLERNVGQALGLGAVFDPKTHESTVVVAHLNDLETLARKITPPAWPESSFGKIDEAKKTKGRDVFVSRCQSCHADLVAGNHTMPDKRFDLDKIGTDPVRANNFARDVEVNGQQLHFDDALSDALKKITRQGGGTVSDKKEWRVTNQYGARPLVASWATAPYLHNNSVPTIWDLLTPVEQRPKVFWVGSREYDSKKLGFKSDEGLFKFDTSVTGNGNGGHTGKEYGTDMSDDDRWALLEYLKSVR
jgi:mono/diheme cytochrome c family protein